MRTVITNDTESAGETIDDAWQFLTDGDAAGAATMFRRHIMDEQRGTEAMAGYGLAKLLADDVKSAATALRRAQRIDDDVLQRLLIDENLREQLMAVRDGFDDSTENDGSDDVFVRDALDQLLQ